LPAGVAAEVREVAGAGLGEWSPTQEDHDQSRVSSGPEVVPRGRTVDRSSGQPAYANRPLFSYSDWQWVEIAPPRRDFAGLPLEIAWAVLLAEFWPGFGAEVA